MLHTRHEKATFQERNLDAGSLYLMRFRTRIIIIIIIQCRRVFFRLLRMRASVPIYRDIIFVFVCPRSFFSLSCIVDFWIGEFVIFIYILQTRFGDAQVGSLCTHRHAVYTYGCIFRKTWFTYSLRYPVACGVICVFHIHMKISTLIPTSLWPIQVKIVERKPVEYNSYNTTCLYRGDTLDGMYTHFPRRRWRFYYSTNQRHFSHLTYSQ